MKNIQVFDGAENAAFSIFQATDEEFEAIFPDGRDMEGKSITASSSHCGTTA